MIAKKLKSFCVLISLAFGLTSCGSSQYELDKANERIAELEATILKLKEKTGETTATTLIASPVVENTPNAAEVKIEAPKPAEPAQIPSDWYYHKSEDSMSGKANYYAQVKSKNTVQFSFPYGDPQHGTLIVRESPRHGKDVIFKIEKGQILCSAYDGCTVLVRFDEGKATRYSANEPADNSSETLFISNYSRFMENLKKSKVVRISPTVYQEGSPVFEFNIENFDPKLFKPKS